MPSSKPPQRFQDIVDNIDKIELYLEGVAEAYFLRADSVEYDATERCFERISEAATKLGLLAEQLEPGLR